MMIYFEWRVSDKKWRRKVQWKKFRKRFTKWFERQNYQIHSKKRKNHVNCILYLVYRNAFNRCTNSLCSPCVTIRIDRAQRYNVVAFSLLLLLLQLLLLCSYKSANVYNCTPNNGWYNIKLCPIMASMIVQTIRSQTNKARFKSPWTIQQDKYRQLIAYATS